jgi:serine/threonine protein kinase
VWHSWWEFIFIIIIVHEPLFTLFYYIEYLAPEFVFNLGHDYSADLWALGITLYEMFLGATPFAPKKADNITELFNNIAITKVNSMQNTNCI